ncbi:MULTISPECIES: cytochrome P450 [unclassified Streptomyces]|uniref:cytochrome P450 n=1 Tax=unclassified Streptomyces TaxID=2593676 RepID=UPI00068B43AA|nr:MULTISPECIES: cytochrome P450 [unclassified Streptomyces]
MSAVGDIPRPTVDRRTVLSVLRRLRSPEGQSNPLPLWEEFRALGDVVPAPWGGYFVTGYDVCNQVLRDRSWHVPDFAWQDRQPEPGRWGAAATREMGGTLSRLNAPEHTCQRRALGNPFDRTTLQDLTPVVAGHVEDLLDDLEDRLATDGEADFLTTVAERLPIRTVGHWLGLPPEDHARIVDFAHRQVFAQELTPTRSELEVSAEATAEMRAYFTELIARRRADPGDDALSGWIRHWDAACPDDPATADHVLYHLTMFITIASMETTATTMANAVWLLGEDPARWAWLREHREFVDGAVEETLRYDPPVHLTSRYAAEDTELAGVPMPRDTMVHVLYGAAAHDPRRNPDPGTFDPTRAAAHLSFGGGAHYCLGAALARLEIRTLLARLLERFPTLRPVSAPAYAPRMVFRRVTSLKVTLPKVTPVEATA